MVGVQLAKDTFYATLRDRIAAANHGRTMVVRGVVRPGVLAAENELPGAAVDGLMVADAFCLHWLEVRVSAEGASALVGVRCEIRYSTDGGQFNAGIDRGRRLTEMDEELSAAVNGAPQRTAGMLLSEVTGGGAVQSRTAGTVFWGDVLFHPALMRGERMERTAEVEVWAYGI